MHPESTHAQLIPKAQSSDCIKHSVLSLFLYFSLFIITMRADVVKKALDLSENTYFRCCRPREWQLWRHFGTHFPCFSTPWCLWPRSCVAAQLKTLVSLIYQFKSSDSPIIKRELWLLFLFQHEHEGLFWVATPVSEQVQPASACPV